MADRPKKAVWISSHCYTRCRQHIFFLVPYTYYFGFFGIFRSRRHLYVKELQKYMEVDQLGGCGKRYFYAVRKKQS